MRIHPIGMKVFVCFAAICFLALVVAQEEDVDVGEVREARGGIFDRQSSRGGLQNTECPFQACHDSAKKFKFDSNLGPNFEHCIL